MGLVEDEDEPMSVMEALRFTIPRMGVAEFCKISGNSKSDVDKFIRGERNLKPDTLDEYLTPFGLKVKIVLDVA